MVGGRKMGQRRTLGKKYKKKLINRLDSERPGAHTGMGGGSFGSAMICP